MSWTKPDIETLYDAIDATWAPFEMREENGWIIREGRGGGKRVSAATQTEANASIENAERAMDALEQQRMFMIRAGFPTLEIQLARRQYSILDATLIMACETTKIAAKHPVDISQDPSKTQAEIWAAGGVNSERLDVMRRVSVPKACLSIQNKAAAFAAIHDGVCMVHCVEVIESMRRQGLGKQIMQAVAEWAAQNKAHTVCILVVAANHGAKTMYEKMGLVEVGKYHYRIKR
ncbi:N-acetyltransferase [Amylibacter ulvae]|uniref:N-acetyltransferase n=1 Tax=Paramylibacter ulvae TaxID=1651968 RepID=A0ABQ3CXH7_9RHOB|nr:GNAT family N-acetyltransferase [Amylibacter ulvae]GHA48150.1 N-acetyltransferase [Amylibacter ulvae]